MVNLLDKKCRPCEGNVKPFSTAVAKKYMKEVDGWKLLNGKIEKDFKFKNFKEAMLFVNTVAMIADLEGHHPDIFLHGWNKVKLTLFTHVIKGLSENDFIVAAKINEIVK